MCFVTVSAQSFVPRGRFPRALRLAALAFEPCRIGGTPCDAFAGADMPVTTPTAVRIRSARRAEDGIHRRP